MIIKEFYRERKDRVGKDENGNVIYTTVNLYRTYSDQNLMIQKVGTDEIYSEAIDVESANFEYVETDKKIKNAEREIYP